MARSLRNLSWKGQKEEVGNFDLLRFEPPPTTSSSSGIEMRSYEVYGMLVQIQSSDTIPQTAFLLSVQCREKKVAR